MIKDRFKIYITDATDGSFEFKTVSGEIFRMKVDTSVFYCGIYKDERFSKWIVVDLFSGMAFNFPHLKMNKAETIDDAAKTIHLMGSVNTLKMSARFVMEHQEYKLNKKQIERLTHCKVMEVKSNG